MPMLRLCGGSGSIGLPVDQDLATRRLHEPGDHASVVVLPEPDGPSSVRNSPVATLSDTPSTATPDP